jgi:T-complex protein 1 subunit theta
MISANSGDVAKGLNIINGEVEAVSGLGIFDHRHTKEWAIRLASEAVITILKIDQIIVAKPAGGPKPQSNKNWDED